MRHGPAGLQRTCFCAGGVDAYTFSKQLLKFGNMMLKGLFYLMTAKGNWKTPCKIQGVLFRKISLDIYQSLELYGMHQKTQIIYSYQVLTNVLKNHSQHIFAHFAAKMPRGLDVP